MFIGKIGAEAKQGTEMLPSAILKAVEYLRSHDFTKIEDGKYLIDGEKMYASVQRYHTRQPEDCHPETHKNYVDIQYIAQGEECLGWCPLSPDLKISVPYDEKKDVAFYEKLIPDSSLVLTPDCYAVLYTDDVHMPCMALDDAGTDVIKVVVKIATEIL